MLHLLLQTFFAFPYGRNHSLSMLIDKIFEVNIPPIRLRKLSTFQIQKLIGRYLVWQNIRFILPHQHSGEKHSMERNVVFPNKMDKFTIRVQPVVFPKLRFSLLDRPLLSHRNIANRSIKPDVKYFPWIARDWDTPI